MSRTSRRDFLSGRAVAQVLAERAGEAGPHGPADGRGDGPVQAPGADTLISVGRRAMGCRFQVLLPPGSAEAATAAADALRLVAKLEDQMTVYRNDSELSRINAQAAHGPVPVERRLFELLQTAEQLSGQTEGAFDIAAGALVRLWGFVHGPRRVPSRAEITRVLQHVGSRHLALDADSRTIAVRRAGVELNLGAIGKGYALDRAAELLRQRWGLNNLLLHGGHSSVYAAGRPSLAAADSRGWPVGIVDPCGRQRRIAVAYLRDCALGTSGATMRYFESRGRRWGHILDPRTGWPAPGQACVSVIAPTAAEADALSTALYVLGPQRCRQYVEEHPGLGAVLVYIRTRQATVALERLGRAEQLVELTE